MYDPLTGKFVPYGQQKKQAAVDVKKPLVGNTLRTLGASPLSGYTPKSGPSFAKNTMFNAAMSLNPITNLASRVITPQAKTNVVNAAIKAPAVARDSFLKPAVEATVVKYPLRAAKLGGVAALDLASKVTGDPTYSQKGRDFAAQDLEVQMPGILRPITGRTTQLRQETLRNTAGEALDTASWLYAPGKALGPVGKLLQGANPRLVDAGADVVKSAFSGYLGDVGVNLQDPNMGYRQAMQPGWGTAISAAIPAAPAAYYGSKYIVGETNKLMQELGPAGAQAGFFKLPEFDLHNEPRRVPVQHKGILDDMAAKRVQGETERAQREMAEIGEEFQQELDLKYKDRVELTRQKMDDEDRNQMRSAVSYLRSGEKDPSVLARIDGIKESVGLGDLTDEDFMRVGDDILKPGKVQAAEGVIPKRDKITGRYAGSEPGTPPAVFYGNVDPQAKVKEARVKASDGSLRAGSSETFRAEQGFAGGGLRPHENPPRAASSQGTTLKRVGNRTDWTLDEGRDALAQFTKQIDGAGFDSEIVGGVAITGKSSHDLDVAVKPKAGREVTVKGIVDLVDSIRGKYALAQWDEEIIGFQTPDGQTFEVFLNEIPEDVLYSDDLQRELFKRINEDTPFFKGAEITRNGASTIKTQSSPGTDEAGLALNFAADADATSGATHSPRSADPLVEEARSAFPKSKIQTPLYHGTHENFKGFDPNFDYDNIPESMGQIRDYEVPQGFVFLTDDSAYAKGYGQKVVPVDVDARKVLKIDAGDKAPSRLFDDDYNGEGKIWQKFINGGYDVLQITGKDGRGKVHSTFIASPEKLKIRQDSTSLYNKAKGDTFTPNLDLKTKPQAFKGFDDLSLKTLEKLKGKTTVSRQFISDLVKGADIKKAEREAIEAALAGEGQTVNVSEFANKVKGELLPLEPVSVAPQYESVTLPDEMRGNIANYEEHVYNSPIKTSAGDVHFSNSPEYADETAGYFGHTRIEDMADNQTRRVIEVQSDLYQKGRLEEERQFTSFEDALQEARSRGGKDYEAKVGKEKAEKEARELAQQWWDEEQQLSKLSAYNDPTAHFRMIREEVKKAAQDGKTKLQFPTGETAMKIEGLGTGGQNWYATVADSSMPGGLRSGAKLAPESLTVGQTIMAPFGREQWIITDVLGDGKFKAVPKDRISTLLVGYTEKEAIDLVKKDPSLNRLVEEFDISGKVDTNNPIYKFYEKEVGKYLTKYNARRIVDAQGVSWWEVPLKREYAEEPVMAFNRALTGEGISSNVKTNGRVSAQNEYPYSHRGAQGDGQAPRDNAQGIERLEKVLHGLRGIKPHEAPLLGGVLPEGVGRSGKWARELGRFVEDSLGSSHLSEVEGIVNDAASVLRGLVGKGYSIAEYAEDISRIFVKTGLPKKTGDELVSFIKEIPEHMQEKFGGLYVIPEWKGKHKDATAGLGILKDGSWTISFNPNSLDHYKNLDGTIITHEGRSHLTYGFSKPEFREALKQDIMRLVTDAPELAKRLFADGDASRVNKYLDWYFKESMSQFLGAVVNLTPFHYKRLVTAAQKAGYVDELGNVIAIAGDDFVGNVRLMTDLRGNIEAKYKELYGTLPRELSGLFGVKGSYAENEFFARIMENADRGDFFSELPPSLKGSQLEDSINKMKARSPELYKKTDKGFEGWAFNEQVKTSPIRQGGEIGTGNTDEMVARERFNIPELEKVSFGGSDRDVYDLGDGKVLKVAKTARGLGQNRYSVDYYAEDNGLIPRTLEAGKNYVVKEKVLSPNAVTKKMVADFKKELAKAGYGRNGSIDAINAMAAKPEYEDVYAWEELLNWDVMWGDLAAIRNWGTTKDGLPVLLDEGTLSQGVIDEYTRPRNDGYGRQPIKNMDDPDFRDAYNQSRAARKQYGDRDNKTMYNVDPEDPKSRKSLQELSVQIDVLKEMLDNHPGKNLVKYQSKAYPGQLPEVAAGKKSKFGKHGDRMISELAGVDDLVEADNVLQDYLKGKKRLENLKQEYTEMKGRWKKVLYEDADRSSQVAQDKAAGLHLRKMTRSKEIPSLERAAEEHMGAQKFTPTYAKESTTAVLDDMRISKDKHQVTKPIEQIVIETPNTPYQKKIGLLDYLRTPDRVFKKIGLSKQFNYLRKQYDRYLQELPKEIDRITDWSKRVDPKANERIFDFLDGKIDGTQLSPEEYKVAGEIRAYLKDWAVKLGLDPQRQITHYITHIFDEEFLSKEFSDDLAKLIADKVPGSVYDPFLQSRLGKLGYKRDTWAALDAYTKRAVRKYNMDPALDAIKREAETLELSQLNYVKKFADRVNMRPTTIDSLLDVTIKNIAGYKFGARPTARITQKGRRIVYRALLGLNPASALRNLSQGANTYAKLGEKYTTLGYIDVLKNAGSDELERVGVLNQDMIQDRNLSAHKKFWEKMDKGLFAMFEFAERVNRGAAYYGAKRKAINSGKGEEEAIEFAKKIVRDTQFTFGSIDTPAFLQSDLAKTLLQFQTYPTKQTEFLVEMAKNKEYAGMLRYAAATLAFTYTIGELFDMEWSDALPAFRFGKPPLFEPVNALYQSTVTGKDRYGNEMDTPDRVKNVGESALNYFVPAGGQIKKSIKGFAATKGEDAGRVIRGTVFGKSALPTEKSEYQKAQDDKKKVRDASKERIRPVYDKAQALSTMGREDEAQALVDGLSEADYEIYKAIRTAEKTKKTKELKEKMYPKYLEIQRLVKAGNTALAQQMVDAMTDEEYHAYELLKEGE